MWNFLGINIHTLDWMTVLLYGIFFILMGIVIILVPEILIALIAGTFIAIGAFLIYGAWQIRKAMNRSQNEWIEIHFRD